MTVSLSCSSERLSSVGVTYISAVPSEMMNGLYPMPASIEELRNCYEKRA